MLISLLIVGWLATTAWAADFEPNSTRMFLSADVLESYLSRLNLEPTERLHVLESINGQFENIYKLDDDNEKTTTTTSTRFMSRFEKSAVGYWRRKNYYVKNRHYNERFRAREKLRAKYCK